MTRDEARMALGAYVLGALAADERTEVERWLNDDADLRDELARLAALPGLLSRLDLAELELELSDSGGPAHASGVEAVLAAAKQERARSLRRLRRWRFAAALAAVLALVAGVVATVALVGDDGSGGRVASEQGPVVAVDVVDPVAVAAGLTGELRANPRGWGAEVEVYLWDVPSGPSHFTMVVVGRDGRREEAASWGPPPSGQCRVVGATSIPAADIAQVEIVVDHGPLLATATLL